MSTVNDMTEPASTAGSISRGADGVAASRSTVDIELVCVKGKGITIVAAIHGQVAK